jgi:hypothetical protein
MDFHRCSTNHRHPIISVEECGRKFIIHNPNQETVRKVKVDGCLINDHRKRCDYLFEIGRTCKCVIYLELKGSDIGHAIEQLISTLELLKHLHENNIRVCVIVARRVPRAGPKVQVLKVKMAKKYQVRLITKTDSTTIDISQPPYC